MEDSSNTLESLKARVEKMNFGQISPGLKAQLSCEMVKEELIKKEVTQEDALNFALSLIQFSVVPVTIGVEGRNVFPIKQIMQARPFKIQQLRDAAREDKDIDFDKDCETRSDKAKKVIALLEKNYSEAYSGAISKFGPFARFMTGEQIDEEANQILQTNKIAGEMLMVDVGQETQEAVDKFMKVDVPNVFFGSELVSYIESMKD